MQSEICDKFKAFCKAYKDARSTLFPFRILFYVGISKEPVHSCVYFTQIHSISRKKKWVHMVPWWYYFKYVFMPGHNSAKQNDIPRKTKLYYWGK